MEWDVQQGKYWIEKFTTEKEEMINKIGPQCLDDDIIKDIMYSRFHNILKWIKLDNVQVLRFIISAKRTYESLDMLGQNFMHAYFFRDFELELANQKLKELNDTHKRYFILDQIITNGFMPRQMLCAEDYAFDDDMYKSLN